MAPDAVAAVDTGVPGEATPDAAGPEAAAAAADTSTPGVATADTAAAETATPSTATPDEVAPEVPAMAAGAPSQGLASSSSAAPDAAIASASAPEGLASAPDAPLPSSPLVVEEELEEVPGRRLLRGSPEEVPLPRVLVRLRWTIEEATGTAEAAFRRELEALESERREKGVALREADVAKAEASLAAQRSVIETRSQSLEVRKQELEKLSETLHGWREQLQVTASQQAVAEMELEKERQSLARRESHATNIETQLGRQRDGGEEGGHAPGEGP
ncbi:translation initiation factor IF-2-like [Panicum virgatum]|uniref:translation initiation factor IF-2-like n=1 Tax=Panicum virgatum TaxID=38727 RepID=UPI0019D5EDED|nr:translation initiation factor IF-2-like [Panicum virgatum]